MNVFHNPANYETRREPLAPDSPSVAVEVWVITSPIAPGQSVWICYQEFDRDGNLIQPQASQENSSEGRVSPLHFVSCNWRYNSGQNASWSGIIGPFSPKTTKVVYNLFARQGRELATISTPDYFQFSIASPVSSVDIAPGAPGSPPLWSSGAKHGFGTSRTTTSKVWFTLSDGAINEIYYPLLDKPNVRDLQFLVLDENGEFNDPKSMKSVIRYLDTESENSDGIPRSLAYHVTNYDEADRPGLATRHRYELDFSVITDPTEDAVLIGVSLRPLTAGAEKYRVFVLFSPHMDNSGWRDSGKFVERDGHVLFVTWENGVYAALAVSRTVPKYSVGYVGKSDGWTLLKQNGELPTYRVDQGGNIASTMEIGLSDDDRTALISLSFGKSETEVVERALRTITKNFSAVAGQYIGGWKDYLANLETNGNLGKITNGQPPEVKQLAYVSTMVVKACEDKTYPGAIIASPSIPWGDCTSDNNQGGYHLVWARDLYNMATAAMAIGDWETAHGILRYYDEVQQESNGSMPQNSWIDGMKYWQNEQLDETGYPIILAWRMKKLGRIDANTAQGLYTSLVVPAADYLADYNDTWTQDRWEEVTGRSPFSIAVVVAALVVAASWAKERGQTGKAAQYLAKAQDFAVNDYRDCYVSRFGKNYYARAFNPDVQYLLDVIDGGFIEAARVGLKGPSNSKLVNSVATVDACIRKDINGMPYFLRYGRADSSADNQNGLGRDTYGELDSGKCWTGDGSGRGRFWPLLTGERGHWELLRGDLDAAKLCLRAMASSANQGLMLPEQIWGAADIPVDEHGNRLANGKGTKSATPLGWAHGEFIKLLRSITDGAVFDLLPEVEQFARTTDGDGGKIYDT